MSKNEALSSLLKTKKPTVYHEPCQGCFSQWQLTRSGFCRSCRPTLQMGSKKALNGGKVFQGRGHTGQITEDAI